MRKLLKKLSQFLLKWPVAILILVFVNTIVAAAAMGLLWYAGDDVWLQALVVTEVLAGAYLSVFLVQRWLLSRSFEFQNMKLFLVYLGLANAAFVTTEIVVIVSLLGYS